MKHHATTYLCLLLACFAALPTQARQTTPTIDGQLSAGETTTYNLLATWTQADTGFGDHGMKELYGFADDTFLYVMIVGECEDNANDFFLLLNASTPPGVSSGNQLPAGSDGLSPFISFRPTNDFEVDFGLRMTNTTDETGTAFFSIIDYTLGGNTDTFLGSALTDGTVAEVTSGTYDGAKLAYQHTAGLSAVTNEGWEMAIPLAALGSGASDTFELFALYGNDSFMSANTLPEIAGQSGTNLGNTPDFSAIDGNQHTTDNALPVELVSFTAQTVESAVLLTWRTASEQDNLGFEVEQARETGGFVQVGFVAGQGTTTGTHAYTFTIAQAPPGRHRFRLKQVDTDGAFRYSPVVEVVVDLPRAFVLEPAYPNPFNPSATVRFGVQTAAEVRLALYNALGQEVQVLYVGRPPAGELLEAQLNGADLPSGIYYLRLAGAGVQAIQQVTLVK